MFFLFKLCIRTMRSCSTKCAPHKRCPPAVVSESVGALHATVVAPLLKDCCGAAMRSIAVKPCCGALLRNLVTYR